MAQPNSLPPQPVLIAVVQMSSTHMKQNNLHVALDLMKEAATRKAKVIFLPDCVDFVARNEEEAESLAETLDGPIIQAYQKFAEHYKLCISVGGCHLRMAGNEGGGRGRGVHKSHVFINEAGRVVACYNGVHSQGNGVLRGQEITAPVDSPAGRIGLAQFDDVEFPELSLCLRDLGAEVLTFPAALVSASSQSRWETLLRARAIENQCYVVAAAQTGKHYEQSASFGHSMIVSPWGEIVTQCADEKSVVLFANLDLNKVQSVRSRIPVEDHHRRELFPLVVNLGRPSEIGSEEFHMAEHTVHADFVFYRTVFTFACVSPTPLLPGHVVVCPISPVSRLHEMSREQVSDLFACVQRIVRVLPSHYGGAGMTISVQDGADTGRKEEHLQVHLLPRKFGDLPNVDDIYSKLEGKHEAMEVRSHEEMAEISFRLRQLFYS